MSSPRFAAITSGLLARKGEARPWGMAAEEKPVLEWREPRPAPALPSGPLKSCTLRLTAQDYERLGILAVKTGKSRQQLLKDALNELLAARGRQLSCACLGTCEKDCCG